MFRTIARNIPVTEGTQRERNQSCPARVRGYGRETEFLSVKASRFSSPSAIIGDHRVAKKKRKNGEKKKLDSV